MVEGRDADKLSVEFMQGLTDVVFLNTPFRESYPAAVKRNTVRLISGEKICGENRETILSFIYISVSMVVKHLPKKALFREMALANQGVNAHIFDSRNEAYEWLEQLS